MKQFMVLSALILAAVPAFATPYERGSLSWPFAVDTNFTIGNTPGQLQSYSGERYFHGGCDVVLPQGTELLSPVRGRVEAGYYSSTPDKFGNLSKAWLSLKDYLSSQVKLEERDLYFEVAVVDANGFRFQFHHIDRSSMSEKLVRAVLNGETIDVGSSLGRIIDWPAEMHGHAYHHTHYDIIAPGGTHYNCEWFSKPTSDRISPTIKNVYAVYAPWMSDRMSEGLNGRIRRRPVELAIDAFDRRDTGPFVSFPVFVEVQYGSGTRYTIDFREKLQRLPGRKPKLFDIYSSVFFNFDENVFVQSQGNYSKNQMVIRVPLRNEDFGESTIVVRDFNGNETRRAIFIPAQSE